MVFWKKAVLCVVGVQLLGNASGWVTVVSLDGWYASLRQPPGTPPNGLFGPVWLVIYTLMGYALALVWDRTAGADKGRAYGWFGLQFVLNLMWTPAFFGGQRMDIALAIILMLLVAIALTLRAFYPISRSAAGLLVPYFLWVGYACYLNLGFLLLNS